MNNQRPYVSRENGEAELIGLLLGRSPERRCLRRSIGKAGAQNVNCCSTRKCLHGPEFFLKPVTNSSELLLHSG